MSFRKGLKRNIVSSPPGKVIIRQSKRMYLPGLHGFSVFEVWMAFLAQMRKTSLRERASGISFNIVMAIPPTLIFIFTLIPYLPISEAFIRELFSIIKDIIPGEKNNSVVIQFLDDFIRRPRTGLLSFGLLVAIWFSSNAMMGILRSFDRNYPGFLQRKGWQRRKVALKLTMITFLLVFICILLLMAQDTVLQWLGINDPTLVSIIHNARWILLIMLTFYIISFIYRHGPPVMVKWPLFTPGSVIATTLLIVSTAIVSYWVTHFGTYNKLYGSLSAILILMSLIFVNSFAVLIGFELNVTLSDLREQKEKNQAAVEAS